jgi:hypothetical protein
VSAGARSWTFVLSAGLGLVLGLNASDLLAAAPVRTEPSGEAAAPASANPSPRADLHGSPRQAVRSAGTALPIARPAPPPHVPEAPPGRGDAQLERLIAKNGLGAQREVVERVVPPGPVHTALVNLVLLSTFQNAVGSEESQRMYDEVHQLEAQPAEAGEAIVATIESLPGEHAQARQSLVTFLRQLNLPVEQRTGLLQRVLNRPLPEPNGGADDLHAFGAIAALQTLMDLHRDEPDALEPLVEQAMQAQRDNPELQRLLLLTYTSVAPERARDLQAQLELP